MNRRSFLKAAAIVGGTLAVREVGGMALKKAISGKKTVLAIDGGMAGGTSDYALSVVGETLREEGVDFEVIHIGEAVLRGCTACRSCRREERACVLATEEEIRWIEAMKRANAVVLAAPTCFGGIPGTMKSFLDKAFFANSKHFKGKTGAAVVTTPRTGASMTFEGLNQYFTICEMPVASSTYWNNVRGLTVDDLKNDAEGIRTMQNLGRNIAKLIKN
ncbi:FMN reductase [Bacteroidia bacterium]|nr:FMN reductase [Bacteroidia bacterium]